MPPPQCAAPVAAPSTPAGDRGRAEPADPETSRPIDPTNCALPRPAPLRTRSAEPAKLNGQVAVLVSRKEKRIFVRHAFVPLFDMPVEIANPDYPIGHHVYTALEVQDGGARMRWNVITMPPPVPPARASAGQCEERRTAQPEGHQEAEEGSLPTTRARPRTPPRRSTASPIPQEAIDRISELLVPGSSLIISDEGLGRETGRYTEFIVETRPRIGAAPSSVYTQDRAASVSGAARFCARFVVVGTLSDRLGFPHGPIRRCSKASPCSTASPAPRSRPPARAS